MEGCSLLSAGISYFKTKQLNLTNTYEKINLCFLNLQKKFNVLTSIFKNNNLRYSGVSNNNLNFIHGYGLSFRSFSETNKNQYFFKLKPEKQPNLTKFHLILNKVKSLYKDKEFNSAEFLSSMLVGEITKVTTQYPKNIDVLKIHAEALTWKGITLTGGGSNDAKQAIESLEKALEINPNHGLAKKFIVKNQLALGIQPPGYIIRR